MRTTDKFVFFYGTSDIYSNWHPADFYHRGVLFRNSEQAMMYEKALLMGDTVRAGAILETPSPRDVKQLGRQIAPWNQELWDKECLNVMVKVCLAKFRDNPGLRKQLLATGDKMLVEAASNDRRWGIGMRENEPGVEDPANWKGQNLLGIALMRVREILASEQLC